MFNPNNPNGFNNGFNPNGVNPNQPFIHPPPNQQMIRMPHDPMAQGFLPIQQRSAFSRVGGFWGFLAILIIAILVVGGLAFLYHAMVGIVEVAEKSVHGYYSLIDDLFDFGPFSSRGSQSLASFLFFSFLIAIVGRYIFIKAKRNMNGS